MVFASRLFTDEEQERAFGAQVEAMLRDGAPDLALAAVDARLRDIGEHPVAKAALALDPESVRLIGWNRISDTLAALDAHGQPITAVTIDFTSPMPDDARAERGLAPLLETRFYCDEVFPFSTSDRAAINAGYGRAGACWQGGYEHLDHDIAVTGLDALYGISHPVKVETARGDPSHHGEPADPANREPLRLAAVRAAVLLHMAIGRAVAQTGLPRPLAVLCGSNGVYPFFDAPVTSRAEYEEGADVHVEAGDTDESLFTSLALLAPVRQNAGYQFTPETEHVSGRTLRHRFMGQSVGSTNDEPGLPAAGAVKSTGLLGRLFRRSA